MNNFKTSYLAVAFIASLAIVNSSCKKQFDAPPPYAAAGITPNSTIRDLKARHTSSSDVELITDDVIIKGIVIADDKSGNYFKSLVIQDATGGILIRLEGSSLYTAYPVGMELVIKCKGLYLGDYNGLIQLGGDVDNSGTFPSILTIPSSLFNTYLVKGSTGNVVTPKVVTPAMLTTSMQDTLQNTLIKLEGFEFAAADTSKTYATPTPPTSVNFVIKNCGGNTITLRNSGFANFVSVNVPNGNGSIVSVYTVFGSTKQLTIRDTSDVKFYGTRCGGVVVPPPPPPPAGTVLLNENFESVTTTGTTPVALTGWKNIAPTPGTSFLGKLFSSNKYAQVSAFNSTVASQLPSVKSWLISPALNLNSTTNEKLTFQTVDGFNNGATLKVYYSTNYDGSATPATSTWTELTAVISSGTVTGYAPAFVNSGNVSLASVNGTSVFIAFVYEGGYSPTAKTTTYQIDNVIVSGD
jgi:hypothetical protein